MTTKQIKRGDKVKMIDGKAIWHVTWNHNGYVGIVPALAPNSVPFEVSANELVKV